MPNDKAGYLDAPTLYEVQVILGLGNRAFARRLGIPLKTLVRWLRGLSCHQVDAEVWREIWPVVRSELERPLGS